MVISLFPPRHASSSPRVAGRQFEGGDDELVPPNGRSRSFPRVERGSALLAQEQRAFEKGGLLRKPITPPSQVSPLLPCDEGGLDSILLHRHKARLGARRPSLCEDTRFPLEVDGLLEKFPIRISFFFVNALLFSMF